jgi:hypothetical protein
MSPKLNPLRIVALTVATLIAAWLSFVSWGGVIVFANRIKNLTEFILIWSPPMAFPAALVAWWKSGIGAFLFALVILGFFGPVLAINWPHVGAAARAIGQPFWPFLVSGALLVLVAFYDHHNAGWKNA